MFEVRTSLKVGRTRFISMLVKSHELTSRDVRHVSGAAPQRRHVSDWDPDQQRYSASIVPPSHTMIIFKLSMCHKYRREKVPT